MTRFLGAGMMAVGFLAGADDPAVGQSPYAKPPQAVRDVLDAPPPPAVSLSPARDTLLLIQSARYPGITEVARPFLKLAGYRIDPKTSGPARGPRVTAFTLMPVEGGHPRPVELPAGKVGTPDWAPDGSRFAFPVTTDAGIHLYIADVKTATAVRVPGVLLAAAIADPAKWMPDSKSLLVHLIPADRGPPPESPAAPPGPTVQESAGTAAPVRTYQDLLANAHDEALFAYHATSQLAIVAPGATPKLLNIPATFAGAAASPDGNFVLVSKIQKPYSYLYPASAFPRVVEVWDAAGKPVHTVATLPLQDNVPIEGVPTGPRNISWRPTAPATLVWAEAQDRGDPKLKVPHRDAVFGLDLPGTEARELFRTEHRFTGLQYLPAADYALATDFDRDRRWTRTTTKTLARGLEPDPKPVFDRSAQDRYNDPGTPLSKRLSNGRTALWVTDGKLFLSGLGATPAGDRPFLDTFDLKTRKAERLFRSSEAAYETATPLDDSGTKLLVRRESPAEPGNFYYRDGGRETPITTFTDPTPQLRGITKQLVTTKRPDGVGISFTLYLPPDYKPGERRPTVFWAYPREFNTADTAGQVVGSTNKFTSIAGYSHLFFLLMGYVVMDEVSVPIVGPPDKANDTFVEQLTASAKAAIDKAVELGPVDRDRIGVGGHSYGAFMTANLLAHTDLFRAGVARSGAYNRTLTPFGFQNERRTFWEAPDVYARMSPFHNANRINEPLLLIHGAADDNPGTFPVQSERLYAAVRGTGGTCRLVLLPHEAHGYAARESIEHVLAETIQWFDKYVKHATPRPAKGK